MLQNLSKTIQRAHVFGVNIDLITMNDTVKTVLGWLKETNTKCKFVITPNVDHIVTVQTHQGLRGAYADASLVVTDGRPVFWAANLLGAKLPEPIPGSDLAPAIFDFVQANQIPIKVFLLGAMPGVADRAKSIMAQQWPIVEVVGTLSPPFGFDKNEIESSAICDVVNASGAELLLIGLGAPKQELWIHKHAARLTAKAALCIGATIDFIALEKPRAPIWMRKAGLEWLHRLISEPKRLAKRYLIDAIEFPKIVFNEWRAKK